jgi:hypothetical protein
MKPRVYASSGRPGERRTSCTIGGAVAGPGGLAARLCSFPSLSSLQSLQPPEPPPQAHLRCKADARRNDGTYDKVTATMSGSAAAAGSGIRIT